MEKNILLKDYTTFKIGGPAKYFFIAKNAEDLNESLAFAKKNKLKIFILGGGSNVLFSDKGFNGLVVKLDFKEVKFFKNRVVADAGVGLSKLSNFAFKNNLAGLEWAMGIPGATVGGAIFGNAQAFGRRISDSVESVEALNLKTLKIKNFSKEQCKFSLKNSIFKKNKNLIIISATFNLQKGKEKEIKEKINEFLKHRKKCHPIEFPSAGSIFVNPENKKEITPAGYLIEKCGLKGKKIGGAQISEKHANFIINLGNAKSKDVLALIKLAKQKVKKNFNINLETEVQIISLR
jgi:UDP-N-acetylmuramate dehydrogenase